MKLKIPEKNFETFLCPEEERFQKILAFNKKRLDNRDIRIFGEDFNLIKKRFREELNLPGTVVATGHQPEFSHPGIIYKNYITCKLAKNFNCFPVNVIIDFDIPELMLPVIEEKESLFTLVNLKFPVKDPFQIFQFFSFDKNAITDFCENIFKYSRAFPEPVRDNITACRDRFSKLIETETCHLDILIKLRKEWEEKNSIIINDIKASSIYSGQVFLMFLNEISTRHQEFFLSYNNALNIYRKKNKIRSSANPFPDLNASIFDNRQYHEIPAWYINENGYRFPLYSREGEFFYLSAENKIIRIQELSRIRPKAILNTLFLRLFLCDVFVHGVGGAKYDRITDMIIKTFFKINPPVYLTATMTRKLFEEEPDLISRFNKYSNDLIKIKNHPEKYLPKTDNLLKEKKLLIREINKAAKDEKISLSNRIKLLNNKIAEKVSLEKDRIETELKSVSIQLNNNKILSSREFPYFFYNSLF